MRTPTHTAVSEADRSRLRVLRWWMPILSCRWQGSAPRRRSWASVAWRQVARKHRLRSTWPCSRSAKVACQAGEQRPTHRRRCVRVKPIVRPSVLDAVRDQLLTWLEAQPALTAVAALDRLRPPRAEPHVA